MINNNLALANGNDLRVYFKKNEDCQPREIDRILENIATAKTRVLFKLQEDLESNQDQESAYYLVYGKIMFGHKTKLGNTLFSGLIATNRLSTKHGLDPWTHELVD